MAYEKTTIGSEISQKIMCEILHVQMHNLLPDYPHLSENAKIKMWEHAAGGVVIALRAWILDGHKSDVRVERREIEFPATPWEFFKQRYMPKWFVKRWPVKTVETVYDWSEHHHFVCPHLGVPEKAPHFTWMGRMSGQVDK